MVSNIRLLQQGRLTKGNGNGQAMNLAIMQAAIGPVKATAEAMSEAAGHTERNSAAVTAPRVNTTSSGPAMKQCTFNWKAEDKYNNLLNFEGR